MNKIIWTGVPDPRSAFLLWDTLSIRVYIFPGIYKAPCLLSCSMLDDFSHEMESTHSRLDNVMKKLAKVSNMTTGK